MTHLARYGTCRQLTKWDCSKKKKKKRNQSNKSTSLSFRTWITIYHSDRNLASGRPYIHVGESHQQSILPSGPEYANSATNDVIGVPIICGGGFLFFFTYERVILLAILITTSVIAFLDSVGGGKAGLGRDVHDRRAAAKAKRDLRKVGGLLGGGLK